MVAASVDARLYARLVGPNGLADRRWRVEARAALVCLLHYRLPLKTTMIGLLQTLPPILFGPFIGVIVDRVPKNSC